MRDLQNVCACSCQSTLHMARCACRCQGARRHSLPSTAFEMSLQKIEGRTLQFSDAEAMRTCHKRPTCNAARHTSRIRCNTVRFTPWSVHGAVEGDLGVSLDVDAAASVPADANQCTSRILLAHTCKRTNGGGTGTTETRGALPTPAQRCHPGGGRTDDFIDGCSVRG